MSLLLIYNPVCGDSTAEQFFTTHVITHLHTANRIPTEIVRTRAPGDAGIQVLSFLNRYAGDTTVVLGSGDGTLHEIVNQLAFATDAGMCEDDHFPIRFVLVPCGTANALYASLFRPPPPQETVTYRLQSLEAFLGASTPRPLTLSLTSLLGSLCGQGDSRPVASIVVTSTALHAVILRDSENLRKEIPGIERFRVAAQQNITKWYASHVKLLPIPSSGVVHTYDPQKGDFVPSGDPSANHSALDVHGPFAYFLSTVNVDRLEPEFRINPMISKSPPMDTSMDVVMVRPQRDPAFTRDTLQAREKFAEKIVTVLTTAYQDGNHINLRYLRMGISQTVVTVIRSLNVSDVGGGNGYLFVASFPVCSESLMLLRMRQTRTRICYAQMVLSSK
ncbi:ATP-NAD kinase-like domain-containing protein [Butyriboletus roseoflavus]|nr:ATP-NAD kinase-like domain-containing protein [Butyriboletus roseoflavus]